MVILIKDKIKVFQSQKIRYVIFNIYSISKKDFSLNIDYMTIIIPVLFTHNNLLILNKIKKWQ